MIQNSKKYPARTERNILIEELKSLGSRGVQKSEKRVVAGRVIGILDDGFVVQDISGRLDVIYDGKVNAGDIVQARIGVEEAVKEGRKIVLFRAVEYEILVPCAGEFFIRKDDPNYKRMVVDIHLREKMEARAEVLEGIRNFFRERGFLEAETPEMVRLPGMEPYLDVFKTTFFDRAGSQNPMFLITSPEYAMKKILVSGEEKVFQICKSFRNKESESELHNPEFTLLEWYRAYASYLDIMKDTEELVEYLVKKKNENRGAAGGERAVLTCRGNEIDVRTPWTRVSVKDLFEMYAGVDGVVIENEEKLREAVKSKGYKVNEDTSYEDLFFSVFMNEIEPKLGFDKPVIVYDYPAQMAALAKLSEKNPAYAERFEVYIAGVELCNAFTELNDPAEQKKRLEEERERRREMGKEDYPVDQSFITALEFGMPPAGGNALGVDRLAMLLTDTDDIRDMMFFPHEDL